MNDVTGMPQSAVVLGGSSDLARAVLRRLAARRLQAALLCGRDEAELRLSAEELRSLGVVSVFTAPFDVLATQDHERFAADAFARLGAVDMVLVATGILGTAELDGLDARNVAHSIETNFTGPAAAIISFAKLMGAQGYGRIVVFSSVAGVRVRRSNFVYGAAKAGLDGFCQGLSDSLVGTGVEVMIVRPGFVHTKMTLGLTPPPFATGPEAVAEALVRGLEQGAAVVWVPPVLRYVFAGLRYLPQQLWRRLPG